MAIRDILCPIFSLEADGVVLAAAEAVAEFSGARIKALVVEVEPAHNVRIEGPVERSALSHSLDQMHRGFVEQSVKRAPREFEVREICVSASGAGASLNSEAQLADLTIMLRPGQAPLADMRVAMAEAVLFGSGRPLLLIPPNWRGDWIGGNVVVGWNGSREAARALGDATVFLDQATSITVVCVALGETRTRADASAQSVVAHMNKRGKHAELRHVGKLGFSDGATLFGQAEALDANLVVMGGYGTPRLLERIVGGVTREALDKARVPVLMSH